MSNVLELTKSNFSDQVLNSDLPVLVDFWAPWCMPCKMMAPILDELSIDLIDKLKVAKVNTEDVNNQELAIQYQIQSIPNMKLFKGGKIVAEFIGLRNKETLKGELAAFL
ncbi:MAG: thioredoxin [Patescibacteria group bacterium]|jgi:thioredoxin 1